MAESERRGVTVRSYRAVVDEVERRIYRIDRWRLPTPHGVSVRALAYAVGCVVGIAALSGLPVVGAVLGLLPDPLRLLGLPIASGWALSALRIDGRPPHRALLAATRYIGLPRHWAGLRSCPPVGAVLAPVEAIEIAPSGDEPALRRGRVRGPARITVRYPARVAVERGGRKAAVTASGQRLRPLVRGGSIRVPAGGRVEIR